MGDGDHKPHSDCYYHNYAGDSHPQLTSSTLRFTLVVHGCGNRGVYSTQKIIRTNPLLSDMCQITAYGHATAPSLARTGCRFHGSLSFIWAHYNSHTWTMTISTGLCNLHCPPIVGYVFSCCVMVLVYGIIHMFHRYVQLYGINIWILNSSIFGYRVFNCSFVLTLHIRLQKFVGVKTWLQSCVV